MYQSVLIMYNFMIKTVDSHLVAGSLLLFGNFIVVLIDSCFLWSLVYGMNYVILWLQVEHSVPVHIMFLFLINRRAIFPLHWTESTEFIGDWTQSYLATWERGEHKYPSNYRTSHQTKALGRAWNRETYK